MKETNALQNYVDDIRRIMSPIQVAKTLFLIEKSRDSKELSAEKLWTKQQAQAAAPMQPAAHLIHPSEV
jgi:hypothetical protein